MESRALLMLYIQHSCCENSSHRPYMLMCVQPEHICHRHRPTTDRLRINELAILVRLPSTVRLFEQLDSSTLPLYDALAVKFKTQST